MAGDFGRRALVTGALGGIGSAACRELQVRGMVVVGVDLSVDDADFPVVRCDLTDSGSVERAVSSACEILGGIDVVVNTAGGSARSRGDGPVHECTDEGWDYAISLNAGSVMRVCRAAVPQLAAGSAIVNVGSVLGVVGDNSGSFQTHAYAAAKGAVLALTRAMAATYASRGIRVNAVVPGLIDTPMSSRAQESDEVLRVAAAHQPLTGPLIDSEVVAAAIGYLASSASSAVTGALLPVDGGWLAT